MKIPSTERRALDLMDYFVMHPATQEKACEDLGITQSQFRSAITYLRDHVCKEFGVVIPHPVPDDGFKYHVTGEWATEDGIPALERGTQYALGLIESRLRRVLGDVEIVLPNLDAQSTNGRKANFLRLHLTRIVGTLAEIEGESGLDEG